MGPYLAERQWGTVREDYSPRGTAWDSFPHDHARSRAYRWGEDGIVGICDTTAGSAWRSQRRGDRRRHQTGWTGIVAKLLQQSGER
jgi:hypothetical protein